MSTRARPRSLLLGTLHYWELLSFLLLIISCGATATTYILHDETSKSYNIHRRDREPGSDRRRTEHSSGPALAKVKAQQRLRFADWQARMQPLEARLEQYRDQHLTCTERKRMPEPYIVVRIEDKAAGIGNELPGVITGFFLALLLERCFFVDFPFYNQHFAHELDFSWKNHRQRLLGFGHDPNATEYQPERIPGGYETMGEMWMFKDLTKQFAGSYGLELHGDLDYQAALVQSNPHHKDLLLPRIGKLSRCHSRPEPNNKDIEDFLEKHFPTREVFAALAAFVLQAAPRYEQEVQTYKSRHFKLYTIGMQIRRRKCNGDRKDLHCEYRPSIESYCQVAKSIQMAMGLHDKDVAFFLAADEPATYLQVAQLLGADRVIWTDNGIAPTNQRSARGEFADVWNEAENPGTVTSALIDMALLSHCDDMVVTMASSFGYVAAAWAGYAPVYMIYGEHTSSQNPYWYRAITSEPCFWQAKNMMRQVDARYLNRFRENPFWMQYTQCHNDWE